MKKVHILRNTVFTVLMMFMAVSCNNIFNARKNDKAVLRFSFDENKIRTLFPEASVDELSDLQLYTVADSVDTPLFAEPFETALEFCHAEVELEPGTYTFHLTAKANTTNFECIQEKTLVEGENQITFTLKRMDLGIPGTLTQGIFNYKLLIPSEFNVVISNVAASISLFDENENLVLTKKSRDLGYNLFNSGSEFLEYMNVAYEDYPKIFQYSTYLPVGNYSYIFQIYNKEKTKYYVEEECFSIADNCETNKNEIMPDYISVVPMKFNLNGGSLIDEEFYSYQLGDIINLDQIIPKKSYRAFDGWYLDEQLTQAISGEIIFDKIFSEHIMGVFSARDPAALVYLKFNDTTAALSPDGEITSEKITGEIISIVPMKTGALICTETSAKRAYYEE